MYNPFVVDAVEATKDSDLIKQSLAGDREALSGLVCRHQAWIYNIALRMVGMAEAAEDITQEILIKMMTKLSTYDATKASFRTWLYRIVLNHVINMQKAGYEKSINSLEEYYSFIDKTPDSDIEETPDTKMIIEDLGISCTLAVLVCLERKQRLVFILGVVFNIDSEQGGEILGMSSAAFRKALSRAREKLYNFMFSKCGLVNADAPCHCRKKVGAFIEQGWYSVDNLKFYRKNVKTIEKVISAKADRFREGIYADYIQLYRDHPFYDPPELTDWFKETLERPEFKEIFDLN